METESVRSERSSKSHRSNKSGVVNNRTRHSHRSTTKGSKNMAPFQTSVNLSNDDSRDGRGQEVVEVQILPQDENWGTETHVTGNTSDQSISMEDVNNWPSGGGSGGGVACQKHFERITSLILCMAAFCSPIAMALLPKLGFFPSTFQNEEFNQLTKTPLLACNAECKGKQINVNWNIFIKNVFRCRSHCDVNNSSDSLGHRFVGAFLPSAERRYAKNFPLPVACASARRHLNFLLLALLYCASHREHLKGNCRRNWSVQLQDARCLRHQL